jgi:hypothetical protein
LFAFVQDGCGRNLIPVRRVAKLAAFRGLVGLFLAGDVSSRLPESGFVGLLTPMVVNAARSKLPMKVLSFVTGSVALWRAR